MIDHEKHVGQLLDVLDELGIAEDTIVIYSTDNGPQRQLLARRRHHTVPQRKEHQLGRRIPGAPGDRLARQNHRPQCVQRDHPAPRLAEKPFLAAAGEPDIVDTLKAGHTIGDKTYKVHIDGYNLLPYLTGQEDKSPRRGMIYSSDDGDVLAIRAENWKLVFMEQRCPGTLMVWANPFTALRVPKMFNLRTDPYERADITAVESLHVPPRRGSPQPPDDFRRNPIGLRSLPVRQGEAASADFQTTLASEVISPECRWRRGSDVQHSSDPRRMP